MLSDQSNTTTNYGEVTINDWLSYLFCVDIEVSDIENNMA